MMGKHEDDERVCLDGIVYKTGEVPNKTEASVAIQ